MGRPYIFITICLFISGLGGCKKEMCAFSENDNSYTAIDANANFIGPADPNDWTSYNNFNACENNLFNFTDTFNYVGLTSTTVKTLGVFPNPFYNVCSFYVSDTGTNIVKLVVVDDKMNVLQRFTQLNAVIRSFDFASLDSNTHYRMYYRFYGNNKAVIYQGYGDLRSSK